MAVSDGGQANYRTADPAADAAYRRIVSEFPNTRLVLGCPDGSAVAEWVGEEIADLCGYEVAELEDDTTLWLSIVHPADHEKVVEACRRLATGLHTRTDYRIYCKDGQMRWVTEAGVAASTPQDGIVLSIRCVTDITTAKSAAEWAVDFRELVDETPAAITVRDMAGRLLYGNEATARLYRAGSPDDLLGTTVEDVTTPEFGKEFREDILPLALAGPWSREVRLVRLDGRVVNLQAHTNLFRDNNGQPVAFYSILTDISQLKQTEQALRASEERLRAVQDSLTANLAVLDGDGNIVAVNERWKEFARENGDPGLRSTCEGVNYLDVCRRATGAFSEGAAEAAEGLSAILRGELADFEMEYPCPGLNQSRWFFLRASPLAGETAGAVVAHFDVTRRKLAEQALRTSEELRRRRYDAISSGVIVADPQGRTVYVNNAAAQILGIEREQMVSKTADDGPWRFVREDGSPMPMDQFPAYVAIRTGKPVRDAVFGVYCGDPPQCHWLLLSSEPVLDPATGELLETIDTFVDITEQKRIQEALRESEAKYRSLLENLDAVVFRIDENLRPIALAGQLQKLLGWSSQEFERYPALWQELLHPEDIGKAWDVMERARASGVPEPVELRIRRRTGETRWFRGRVTPVFGGDGELLYFDGVSIDITDLRRAEKAQRETEERYRSVVDTAYAVIFRIDPEGRPIALYGRVADETGYSIGEFMEDPSLWNARIHHDDLERVQASYQEIASTGEPKAIELRIVQKSGGIRWVRAQVTPRYDGDGRLVYFDAVGLDITERVETQEREASRAARMAGLAEVSQEFGASLDSQQILDIATERLCSTLHGASVGATVDPLSGRLLHLSICCPRGCEIESMDAAIRGANLSADEVFGIRGVSPKIVSEFRGVSEVAARIVDTAGCELGPAVVAPVVAGADAIGVLVCARPLGQDFDHEELWFVTEVASHASAALTNAALYKHQAVIAETLQRSLIPETPSLRCLDIATLYSPAPGEAQVGGDFFDVFDFGCSKVCLVVGDVSGKGLDAAIHTAEAKYMIRAFAHQDPSPQHVIHSLNQALYEYLPEETLITLVYFLIDAPGHTMTYVNAGHEVPIVLCRNQKALHEVESGNLVLGASRNTVYTAHQMPFEPDDTLFCYTDGVTDVRANGDRFGYDRLREAVASAPPGDARSLMEHVMERVRGFGPAKQTDDQVVVVVRPTV